MKTWNIREYFTVRSVPARIRKWSTFINGQKHTFTFNPGDAVKHKQHGKGIVVRVRDGIVFVKWNTPIRSMFTKIHPTHLVSGCFPDQLKAA